MAKKSKKAAKKPAKKSAAKKKVAKKKPQGGKPAAKKKSQGGKPATKKKIVAKKKAKPARKKPAAKKAAPKKKVVAKKPAPVKKIEVKKPAAPAPKPLPLSAKPLPVVKAKKAPKKEDLDDEGKPQNKKVVEYEPIFEYKPVMRPKPLGSSPKPFIGKDSRTKYNDEELAEFKDIILKKLEEAQRDYELLKSTLSHKDDHGTDDTSPTFKLLEDGSDVMSKEETAQLAARQEKFIQALQNALIRIENKTYGICRMTGKLIPKERLRSVPHATLSIDAKLEQY